MYSMQDGGATHTTCTIVCRLTDDISFTFELIMHVENLSTTSRLAPLRVSRLVRVGRSPIREGLEKCEVLSNISASRRARVSLLSG
jgi:hypothetical protein